MCLAIPGKIIEIDNKNNKFLIDYQTEKREVNMSLVDVKIGDYVIVSNKIIITKVKPDNAKKFLELANQK